MISKYQLLLFLITYMVLGSPIFGQFYNDFSTNTLTEWSGDTSHFNVENGFLRLMAPYEGNSFIYRKYNDFDSVVYSISMALDFSPSNSNKLLIFLYTARVDSPLETSYYLSVGESGSNDALELHRSSMGKDTILLRLEEASMAVEPANAELSIQRFRNGTWKVFSQYDHSSAMLLEAQIKEKDFLPFNSGYFGIQCNYTSTRTDKFYFDLLSVSKLVPDTKAPFVKNMRVINNNTLQVVFNEPLNVNSALKKENYKIEGINEQTIKINDRTSTDTLTISYDSPFLMGKNYTLHVMNVRDTTGNVMRDTSLNFDYLLIRTPLPYELIFTEIMAAPREGSLPNAEYIEIFNRSNTHISTEGLSISDQSTSTKLKSAIIEPGEYVILCDQEHADDFSSYGKVIPINSFPSLNNSGDSIALSLDNSLIDKQEYFSDWYSSPEYYNAGYSLELHNPDFLCFTSGRAWYEHRGSHVASPGRQNMPWDTIFNVKAEIKSVSINTPSEILFRSNLYFSELNPGDIIIDADKIGIDSFRIYQNIITVYLSEDLEISKRYTFSIRMFLDCVQNFELNTEVEVAIPYKGRGKKICINEIMFDPETGHPQWIELYHSGDNVYSFSDLQIDIKKEDIIFSSKIIEKSIFSPGDYVVLCRTCAELENDSRIPAAAHIVLIKNLETLDREFGEIFIRDSLELIDSVAYSAEWHDVLLSNTEGVSIARISCENDGYSNLSWYSSGFSTPGKTNELVLSYSNSPDVPVEISRVFSPNGDGIEDHLIISYQVEEINLRTNVNVYDIEGRPIKTLANNIPVGNSGVVIWSGEMDSMVPAPPGMYVISIELFNAAGYIYSTSASVTLIK